jgi:glutathionylspermidine synthase
MQRHTIHPREDWQRKVEVDGLTFHSPEDLAERGAVYWDESAYYSFSAAEINTLEAAANELQIMCLATAQHIIDNKRYADLTIPPEAIPLIERSWQQEPPALYGRFDMMYDGSGPPKLLEYNADTPTSLIEAAVTQWNWLKETHEDADQFNSLHERLIAKWQDIKPYLQQPLHFASADSEEDVLTVAYLRDTAQQAGLATAQLLMEEIGWDNGAGRLVDLEGQPIRTLFKLYPWECLLAESFGPEALATYHRVTWIEPIWKMLLANKGILPILWELYPHHPNLLEAYFDDPQSMHRYVRKPLLSREGANITLVLPGASTETDGCYGNGRFVCQHTAPLATFSGTDGTLHYPVLGLWMIDQECGGMGIRESRTPITGNLSSFIPHLFR